MNNGTSSQAPQGSQPHPLQGLIKPEQVSKLPHLSDTQKGIYNQGIQKLWDTLQSNTPDTPEYQAALKRLSEVSQQIKVNMRKWHQEQQGQGPQAAQQNGGARPTAQGPHVQPGGSGHQMPQVLQGRGQAPTNEQFSAKVLQAVQNLQVIVPPQIHAQGQEKSQSYLRDLKTKYAQALQKVEVAGSKLQELQNVAEQRQNQGKSFTTEEAQSLNQMRMNCQKQSNEGREFLAKFRSVQDQLKDQLRAQQVQNSGLLNGNQGPAMTAESVAHSTQQATSGTATQTNQQQIGTDPQNQPQNVNPALEAARNMGARPSISPSNNVQPPNRQLPPSQAPIPPLGNPSHQPVPHPPPHINTSVGPPPQTQSPQSMQPTSAQLGPPHPLTHQDAVAHAARTYSQPNLQTTPQSSTHAHPQMGSRDMQNNNVKMPIPKNLNVPQPQQVSMGPARPTMSGGPSTGAMAPMGQPAIQKHPAYVLEGEGERVLSKKKLEELVRQVTGGGESEEGEGLTAEVEEVS